jgi:hypothetical protein
MVHSVPCQDALVRTPGTTCMQSGHFQYPQSSSIILVKPPHTQSLTGYTPYLPSTPTRHPHIPPTPGAAARVGGLLPGPGSAPTRHCCPSCIASSSTSQPPAATAAATAADAAGEAWVRSCTRPADEPWHGVQQSWVRAGTGHALCWCRVQQARV